MNAQNRHIELPLPTNSEVEQLSTLIEQESLLSAVDSSLQQQAESLVDEIRTGYKPSMLEQFLKAYPLNTSEGLSLMTLAESFQRIPDAHTRNALILDKLTNRDWSAKSDSKTLLVSLASSGLKLGHAMLKPKLMRTAILSVMRLAIGMGMKAMGQAFVLGQNIESALKRARLLEKVGYSYSYDMLGEAAHTEHDADRYFNAYKNALLALVARSDSSDIAKNPGISVKLSALHPRYELLNEQAAINELTEKMLPLCLLAKEHNVGLNIDAEECARLEISLDIIHALIASPELSGWDGLGIVVQAYNRKSYAVIDQLYGWAKEYDRKIMIRLVKGAYWDTEIKLAQTQGLADFPVYTAKHHTDISYLACARKLIRYGERIYPQFATHNAQTAACVTAWAKEAGIEFELQRLHGMGEALHQQIMKANSTRCRIYAPVGTHKDLLAYLVRRLLENGANSSFVNLLADEKVPAHQVVENPLNKPKIANSIATGLEIFKPRINSRGFDLGERKVLKGLLKSRELFMTKIWGDSGDSQVVSPYSGELVGYYQTTAPNEIKDAITNAIDAQPSWQSATHRAEALRLIADLYERDTPEFLALLAREAGKTLLDAINEVREAVDFLRYYADQTDQLAAESQGRGVSVCISPWNFPLAIFTGQIAAACGAGNTVLAKPAEQTSLVAIKAINLWYEAGVPKHVVQLILGTGAVQGNALVSHPEIKSVIFTGSTATAQRINHALTENASPEALLVAETGGLNAMIADASSLPEQVVRDVVASAFQSAGQRCSALRMLYVQEELYPQVVEMLVGAMKLLKVGDPTLLNTDVGPVIDERAYASLNAYIAEQKERVIYQVNSQADGGYFVLPTLIEVNGIEDLDFERFGPILHIASYKAARLSKVIEQINDKGYGLTFAIHSRIQSQTQQVCEALHVGNCYINRNQIGAVVGSQPFGGEGLSGTGPKAGGPNYLQNMVAPIVTQSSWLPDQQNYLVDTQVENAWNTLIDRYSPSVVKQELDCPGVTGEKNSLQTMARGYWLVTGDQHSWYQAIASAKAGNPTLLITNASAPLNVDPQLPLIHLEGTLPAVTLQKLNAIAGVSVSASQEYQREIRKALANREGAIVPLLTDLGRSVRHIKEQHICEDTTASGGNAALLIG